MDIEGAWTLVTWRRYAEDGSITYPFGETPQGVLIYATNHSMAIQMVASERPNLDTTDPIGGTESERANAYSGCLAYFGRWEVDGDAVVHQLDGSLYPNWAGTSQRRPIVRDGDDLILQVIDDSGKLSNDIIWRRPTAVQVEPSQPSTHPGARMPDHELRESFLAASVLLTGFDRVALVGTGVADVYLETVQAAVPATVLASALAAVNEHDDVNPDVLDHPAYGPVAKAIAVLWYTGTWNALGEDWQAAYGPAPKDDTTHLVSGDAYKAALQWAAIGAHPPAANPTGFGSWAEPPEDNHV